MKPFAPDLNNPRKQTSAVIGISLALITVVIWSGNYVVARGIFKQIPPVSLAFYRWAVASCCIIPLAYKNFLQDFKAILKNKTYLFFTALTGVSIFNTLIYLAGHYSSAIDLALIGTTAANIFGTALAALFLKEFISISRITGMTLCLVGVLALISEGDIEKILHFRFRQADVLILFSALCFAIYNTLVKKRPAGISAMSLLLVSFVAGTLMILPFFIMEKMNNPPVQWTGANVLIIAYLGIGNSVIGFLCWNAAVQRIGASRTVIFSTLIPLFSTIEAVWILGERLRMIHLIAGITVILGLVIAKLRSSNAKVLKPQPS